MQQRSRQSCRQEQQLISTGLSCETLSLHWGIMLLVLRSSCERMLLLVYPTMQVDLNKHVPRRASGLQV